VVEGVAVEESSRSRSVWLSFILINTITHLETSGPAARPRRGSCSKRGTHGGKKEKKTRCPFSERILQQ